MKLGNSIMFFVLWSIVSCALLVWLGLKDKPFPANVFVSVGSGLLIVSLVYAGVWVCR